MTSITIELTPEMEEELRNKSTFTFADQAIINGLWASARRALPREIQVGDEVSFEWYEGTAARRGVVVGVHADTAWLLCELGYYIRKVRELTVVTA